MYPPEPSEVPPFRRSPSHLFFGFRAAILVLALAACHAQGQSGPPTFDARNLADPAPLANGWLAQAGDNPAFAQASFDDSHWLPLVPAKSPRDSFPDLRTDTVWYRLHVTLTPNSTGLALQERDLASAFEIYANGSRLMSLGHVAPFTQFSADSRLTAPFSDSQVAAGSLVLAVRAHLTPAQWSGASPPPDPGSLLLGSESALRQSSLMSLLADNIVDWTWAVVVLVVALLALTLFSAQRQRTEYFWTFCLGLAEVSGAAFAFLLSVRNMPVVGSLPLLVLNCSTNFLVLLVYFGFVRQRIKPWIWIYATLTCVLIAVNQFASITGALTRGADALSMVSDFADGTINMFILPAALILALRRGNREAGIILVPMFLSNLVDYTNWGALLLAQIPSCSVPANAFLTSLRSFHIGPVALPQEDVGGVACWLSLAAIMVFRANRATRQQAVLESQLDAARQVQQIIVPEVADAVPGFFIESVYQPAQQVGGDFFQILPTRDGGLLLVVGDIAGKGLPAAMLVSVVVGAIRGVAEYTKDPSELLANLNERLVGRGGSLSTALVAQISAHGCVTIANAGHLSPYLDGREVELPGALPLGVLSGAVYETTRFALPPGSRLTFYSDGVIEAQNTKGELFGFDRAKAISTEPAADIVRAAQQFGQEDDITVVIIERDEAIASAA